MKVKILILLICSVTFLTGCASFAEKQTGQITSEPEGATVYFYTPIANQRINIGVTPCSGYIQQGLWQTYLVAEKSGYETKRVLLPRSGDISHKFVLERSYMVQIAEEEPNLPKDFKREVLQILGTFDKVLNSPRMLASSVVSEGKTQIQNLILDYPDYSDSATVRALKALLKEANFVTSLGSAAYDTQIEFDSVKAIRELINKIQSGLGLDL